MKFARIEPRVPQHPEDAKVTIYEVSWMVGGDWRISDDHRFASAEAARDWLFAQGYIIKD